MKKRLLPFIISLVLAGSVTCTAFAEDATSEEAPFAAEEISAAVETPQVEVTVQADDTAEEVFEEVNEEFTFEDIEFVTDEPIEEPEEDLDTPLVSETIEFDEETKSVYCNGQTVTLEADAADDNKTRIAVKAGEQVYYAAPTSSLEQYHDLREYTVYGGFKDDVKDSDGTTSARYESDTSITMNSGSVKGLVGGSAAGTLIGNANIVLNGGTVGTLVAGNDTGFIVGSTSLTINGGNVTSGDVYTTGRTAEASVLGENASVTTVLNSATCKDYTFYSHSREGAQATKDSFELGTPLHDYIVTVEKTNEDFNAYRLVAATPVVASNEAQNGNLATASNASSNAGNTAGNATANFFAGAGNVFTVGNATVRYVDSANIATRAADTAAAATGDAVVATVINANDTDDTEEATDATIASDSADSAKQVAITTVQDAADDSNAPEAMRGEYGNNGNGFMVITLIAAFVIFAIGLIAAKIMKDRSSKNNEGETIVL